MAFSRRTTFSLEPNSHARAIAEAAERGMLDLTVTNPSRVELPFDTDAILAALTSPRALDYAPAPFGSWTAREAVAALHAERGVDADPARVVLTASTSEAYAFLFALLCDPGDEVLAPQPSYPLFDHLAQVAGARLVPYRIAYDAEWRIDVDSVREGLSLRTRAIILVSPNNPTGSFTKTRELAELAGLGFPLISDEVFAEYVVDGGHEIARTALEADGVLVFALDGLSKRAALPGMKLGWITLTGPESQTTEALARLEVVADTFLSVGASVQWALPEILRMRAAPNALRERIAKNVATLRRALDGTAASVLRVEGGWSAVIRLPRVVSEDAWVQGLLARRSVLVQPGWLYDFADEAFAVVSLIAHPSVFARGAELVAAHVRDVTSEGG